MRIQVYVSEELTQSLLKEATQLGGISPSTLVVKILEEHYGLTASDSVSLPKISAQVFSDVEKYLDTISFDETFTLNEASETLRNLPMIANEKATAMHASIGRMFSYQVRKGIFLDKIDIVRDKNNNAVKDVNLRSTRYKKIQK